MVAILRWLRGWHLRFKIMAGVFQSGKLLALLALSQAASALSLPILARKYKDRRPWLWFTLFMQFAGFAGLAFIPEFASVLWVICLGIGLGGCFALTLIVALDHFEEPNNAGALSALMQGGGFYLLQYRLGL